MDLSMFIKDITLDTEDRIVVRVQDMIKEHLSNKEYRLKVKETLKQLLNDDFKQLEVATASVRVTVADGKGEECKNIIVEELNKLAMLAAQFMNSMGDMGSMGEQ